MFENRGLGNPGDSISINYRKWEDHRVWRERCLDCRHDVGTCYCHRVEAFHCPIQFVILIQREESRRPIATGRMAHLSLANSKIFEGCDFSQNDGVNEILANPTNHPMVLFPAGDSTDISELSLGEKRNFFPPGKQPVVFVIDGTWQRANKMRALSVNLHSLPVIRFTPSKPSNFRIRKQPKGHCYATIEAIHEVIDILAPDPNRRHDHMLEVFRAMVDRQIELEAFHRGQDRDRFR